MTSVACALVFLLVAPQAVGDVETHFDKAANFSAFHTYAWSKGHQAFYPDAHKTIVAAIDAQMAGLGFTQAAANPDVLLTYHTVRGSELDLKALDKLQHEGQDTAAATRILGRLAVVLSQPKSRATLWSAGTRRRLSEDPARWNEDVRTAVASLFATYPGRKKANGH
jgi:Domain of unknown function (DUF4136)